MTAYWTEAVTACLGRRCIFGSVLASVLPPSPHSCLVLPFPCPHQHNCLYGPVVKWIAAVGPKNWNPVWKMGASGKDAGDDKRGWGICFMPKPASPWRAGLPAVWKAVLGREALALGARGSPQACLGDPIVNELSSLSSSDRAESRYSWTGWSMIHDHAYFDCMLEFPPIFRSRMSLHMFSSSGLSVFGLRTDKSLKNSDRWRLVSCSCSWKPSLSKTWVDVSAMQLSFWKHHPFHFLWLE